MGHPKTKKLTKAKLFKREKRKTKREFKDKLLKWKEQIILRDNCTCQKCGKDLKDFNKNVHHIISLQAVKKKYPELLEDVNNGILLCGYCHKFSSSSPHQGGYEFTLWLEEKKKEQYDYLKNILYHMNT